MSAQAAQLRRVVASRALRPERPSTSLVGVVSGRGGAGTSLIAALRETSIVFAVLFGVLILGERLSLARLAAIFATLSGALVVKLARP